MMGAGSLVPLAEAKALEQSNIVSDPAADAATVARLASLSALEYERQREAEAKALGLNLPILMDDNQLAGTSGSSRGRHRRRFKRGQGVRRPGP